MRRAIVIVVVAAAVLGGGTPAWAQGDTGTHEVGHYMGFMGMYSDPGGVRGIVELRARPNGRGSARGILTGSQLQAGRGLRLALSGQSCSAAPSEGETTPVRAELVVVSPGVALLEHEGIWYGARAFRSARSLSLLEGDPDRPIIIGCVPLRRFAVDPTPDRRDDLLLSAARVDPAAGAGEARLLGNLLATSDAPATGVAVLAGLQPGTEYGIGLAGRSCAEASPADAVPLGSVVADATGTAFTSLEMHPATRLPLPDARSLLVSVPGADALGTVACADARTAGVRPLR